ncbi:hypothetical protein [Alicyclobacillus acidiphilus]|uniref:hypothetical protein n=1 Tax=Alicyclobacillus acidiphilus TaxID=182455 RepID=UPI0008298AA9|nr:hypothetical protein [Alicyclobacillus acidiphilus]
MLPVSLRHLRKLTDNTGLLEHCFGKIPRRKEGYSTDDNARALWLCMEWLRYAQRTRDTEAAGELVELADIYFSFLMWVQRESGDFHNNVAYDRTLESETPSDDCLGRTLWALAVSSISPLDNDRLMCYRAICRDAFRASDKLRYARGIAHALAASCLLIHWLEAGENGAESDDDWRTWLRCEIRPRAVRWAEQLCALYDSNRASDWRWFEPQMTYDNGVLPWALFHAHRALKWPRALEIAEETMAFLVHKMTAPGGWLRPIGNRGWADHVQTSMWDQQPLEVMTIGLAASEGWSVTRKDEYRNIVQLAVDWFSGANDAHLPLADPADGSCADALTEMGLNINRGAESTLAYLLTHAIYQRVLETGSDAAVKPLVSAW